MNYHLLSGQGKNSFFRLKKTCKQLCFLLLFTLLFSQIHVAQIRPNINSFTPAQQDQLACAIKNFLDNHHEDFIELHLTPNIHNPTNFLPWHRFFIGKLEEHLNSIGLDQYVPLPKWNPNTKIPCPFYVGGDIDLDNDGVLDVGDIDCNEDGDLNDIGCTDIDINFNGVLDVADGDMDCNGDGDLLDYGCAVTVYPADQHVRWAYPLLTNDPQIDMLSIVGNVCSFSTRANLSSATTTPHNNVHNAVQLVGFHAAPGNPWFYIWHAFIDDMWKDWECNCNHSGNISSPNGGITGADLYMKDVNNDQKVPMSDGLDEGYEPFAPSVGLGDVPIYLSEDIWVRLSNDGIANQVHVNPDYSSTNPNYLYVRVRNRGCQPSNGNEVLKVYFSKASTGLNWNPTGGTSDWVNNGILGDLIGQTTINVLQPGEIEVYEFQWYPPNPAGYTPPEVESHICLLARIETATTAPFGMTFTEGTGIAANVANNNNIVWKNVTVVNTPINGLLRVGNPCDNNATLDFAFTVPAEERGNLVVDEGDFVNGENLVTLGAKEKFTDNGFVTVNLGPDMYQKWVNGGKEGAGIDAQYYTHINGTGEPRQLPLRYLVGDAAPYTIAIAGPDANLKNLGFNANELLNVDVQFHYFTQPQGMADLDFTYNINQVAVAGGSGCDGIGGEGYNIHRPKCPKPDAGPDIRIGAGCQTTLNATPVVSGATYTWFNNATGDYIGSGASINVSPLVTTTYEVQVVMPNGCIGYDIVRVIVDRNMQACNWCFSDLQAFPNPPSTGQLTVAMKTSESADLNIKFMSIMGEIISDRTVTTEKGYNEYNINTGGLAAGIYKLHVKCVNGPGLQIETITIQ